MFSLTERIDVRLYQDGPLYLSLFYVDGSPVLKESMIDGTVAEYIEKTRTHPHLAGFVLDYAV